MTKITIFFIFGPCLFEPENKKFNADFGTIIGRIRILISFDFNANNSGFVNDFLDNFTVFTDNFS